jgi:hypothetical protein
LGVGGDAAGVVVDVGGDDAGADDGEEESNATAPLFAAGEEAEDAGAEGVDEDVDGGEVHGFWGARFGGGGVCDWKKFCWEVVDISDQISDIRKQARVVSDEGRVTRKGKNSPQRQQRESRENGESGDDRNAGGRGIMGSPGGRLRRRR